MSDHHTTRLATRAVIRLARETPGESVAGFLQGLVTHDVARGALPLYAALLTPHGKVLFDFLIWPDGDHLRDASLLIDCEAQAAPDLARRLSFYRLRRQITINVAEHIAVHWCPAEAEGDAGRAPACAVDDPRLAALGRRWLEHDAPDDGPTDGADQAWLRHRLMLGVAEGRDELGDGEILWLETNAAELHGVDFAKGCYIGQENTARMNWRQKVNRRLLVVPHARSDPARQRRQWPELGLALDHRRIEDMPDDLIPTWLAPALRAAGTV